MYDFTRQPALCAVVVLCVSISATNALPLNKGYAHVINVKTDCGARGDGTTDDTEAIKKALTNDQIRFAYFPNGTYLCSEQLLCGNQTFKRRTLHGESTDGAIIKLTDNAAGFGDTAAPKAFVSYEGGFADQNFQNYVEYLTIEVGAGNTGAIALEFQTANVGGVYDVKIRTGDPSRKGYIGLGMTKGNTGPCLIKNVSVEGFCYGIQKRGFFHSISFENITLKNQTICGFSCTNNIPVIFYNLISENSVPAVISAGLTAIIKASLTGGASDNTAIVIEGKGKPLYGRNITTGGYGAAISVNGQVSDMQSPVDEFMSDTVGMLFPSKATMLHLPVEATPQTAFDLKDCADTKDFDPSPGKGTHESLQKAIDAGKKTVIISTPQTLSSTVSVRGKVERIISIGSSASKLTTRNALSEGTSPALKIEDGSAAVVTIERFEMPARGYIENATSRTVVLKDIVCRQYINTVTGGKVFIDDCAICNLQIKGQKTWMRSINPEQPYDPKILNDGSDMWILGLKTENEGTVIKTINGGKTEVFGIFTLVTSKVVPDGQPSFIVDESHFSAAVMKLNGYDFFIKETRDGTLKDIAKAPTHFYSAHNLDISSAQHTALPRHTQNTSIIQTGGLWYLLDVRGRRIARGSLRQLSCTQAFAPWRIQLISSQHHARLVSRVNR